MDVPVVSELEQGCAQFCAWDAHTALPQDSRSLLMVHAPAASGHAQTSLPQRHVAWTIKNILNYVSN